jgi:hypothetical protein
MRYNIKHSSHPLGILPVISGHLGIAMIVNDVSIIGRARIKIRKNRAKNMEVKCQEQREW